MSEARKYRKFSASQKLELVLASLRGDRSVVEICREHAISETLLPEGRIPERGPRTGRSSRARRRAWARTTLE